MSTKRNQFIESFRDPTPIMPLQDILLVDLRADGDSKLVIFDQALNSLIVYKGVNRQLEKKIDLPNVSNLISYYDEVNTRKPIPCIAVASENGFYIYRGLQESFRLKIPNLEPEAQQQQLWLNYESQPNKLAQQLGKLSQKIRLTESAKYFMGATTQARRKQLIEKTLTEGIIEKDCICSIAVIKQEEGSVGNIVLMTELRRMHILDSFGHSIIRTVNMRTTSHLGFAYGDINKAYYVVSLGRENLMSIYQQNNQKHVSLGSRTIDAAMDFPFLFVVQQGKQVSCWDVTKHNKLYSLKLANQPFKTQILRSRGFKGLILGFNNEIRIYNQKLLVYQYALKNTLRNLKFGTFGRQEGCLLIFYEDKGFEVKIMHRQFNGNLKYQKDGVDKIVSVENIPIPKKTNLFVADSVVEAQNCRSIYSNYQKDLRLLKWKCLKEQSKDLLSGGNQRIKISTTVLGMGPSYILRLEVENIWEENLHQVKLTLNYDPAIYEVGTYPGNLGMLVPGFPYPTEVFVKNVSENGQPGSIRVCLAGQNGECSAVGVQIPGIQ